MGLLDLSLPPSVVPRLPAGLPRRVLRRLIVGNALGVGSRVLVAGRSPGDLVEFFDRLGLTASGFDESADSARAARQRTPDLEFLSGSVTDDFPLDEPAFDLVAAVELQAHARSLFARDAFHATANLLSCVKPGGGAVLLVRFAEDGHAPGGHTASCFVRHLAHFPGALEIADFPDGVVGVDPLGWIVGRRPRPGFLLAGLRVPAAAPSQLGWHDQAEAAAAVRRDDCCRLGAAAGRRSAA